MASLFDSWSLANSRGIPQYQGSAIPELTKVASTLEDRYDTGVQQQDLLDRATKTASASTFDQPLLNQLKQQARDKMTDYANKGNYEDMWRNVAMDARDYADKYKTIAGNQQAIQGWQADLNKRVGEGKLDPAIAKAKIAQLSDTYGGLKIDPETGQFTNHFAGTTTVPSVDIPEKINKWLSESHAIERGWKAEKDVNGWYITNGSERKSLPWEKIKPVIDAGVALDPEVKAWLSQEHELAPYYSGVSSKLTPDQVQSMMRSNPNLQMRVADKVSNGNMSPVEALHSVLGDEQVRTRVNSIYDYARKGVVDVQKGEYAEKMDPLTEDRLKKQQEKMLFSVPFSDVSPGTQISSVKDFEGERGKAWQDMDSLGKQLGDLRNTPGVTEQDGKMYRKEADGSTTDITEDANRIRRQIASADDKIKQYDLIKKAAADATGYHPEQSSPTQTKRTKEYEDKLYKQYYDDMLREKRQQDYSVVGLTPNEMTTARRMAQQGALVERNTTHPAYKDYEQELIKRLQPQGEGNKLLVFKDDDMKKTLGDFATSSISQLGLKNGLVSLKVGSGKHMGEDLTADDYDDIKGKIVPVGITNDAATGNTKVVMRAMQDIHGKKVKGENILMSMKDVGGIDDYVRTHTSPEEYHNFILDRTLKSGLNNVAGTMNFPISDKDGANVGAIQITRKKSSTQGPGSFSMRIPTSSGWRQVSMDSYEAVIDAIKQIQAQHQ